MQTILRRKIMIKCVNEHCNNDPSTSTRSVIVNVDGDLACSPECLKEYKKQKDEFLNNIDNDAYMEKWWNS